MRDPYSSMLYGLAALVLAAEAVVFLMAMAPAVDPQYRAYYIDRSTDCYPLPVSGGYQLGERVSFGAPGAAQRVQLARCGWRDPEQRGSWSDGDRSMLRFAVSSPSDLLLQLTMQPFVDALTPRQRVEVSANGTSLATLELTEAVPAKWEIAIPAAAIGSSGLLDITLAYPDARELPGSAGTGRYFYAVYLLDLSLSTQSSAAPTAAGPRS